MDTCHSLGFCTNYQGSYSCACGGPDALGFEGDGIKPPGFRGLVLASAVFTGYLSKEMFRQGIGAAVGGLEPNDVHIISYTQTLESGVTFLGSLGAFNESTGEGVAAATQLTAGIAASLSVAILGIEIISIYDMEFSALTQRRLLEYIGDGNVEGPDDDEREPVVGRRGLRKAVSARYQSTVGMICGNNFRSFESRLFSVRQCYGQCRLQKGCHRFSMDEVHQCRIADGTGRTGLEQCSPIGYGSNAMLYDLIPYVHADYRAIADHDMAHIINDESFRDQITYRINERGVTLGPFDVDTVSVDPRVPFVTEISWWMSAAESDSGPNVADALYDEVAFLVQINTAGAGVADMAITYNTTSASCIGLGNDQCCVTQAQALVGLQATSSCTGRLLLLLYGFYCDPSQWSYTTPGAPTAYGDSSWDFLPGSGSFAGDPMGVEDPKERRIDPEDGNPYTKTAFADVYGGAPIPREPPTRTPPTNPPPPATVTPGLSVVNESFRLAHGRNCRVGRGGAFRGDAGCRQPW